MSNLETSSILVGETFITDYGVERELWVGFCETIKEMVNYKSDPDDDDDDDEWYEDDDDDDWDDDDWDEDDDD